MEEVCYIGELICLIMDVSLSPCLGNSGANDDDDVSTLADGDVQVSTLPSPGTSVASDLDSNVGSVNTDVLLNSFYQHGNSQDIC